MSSIVFFTDKSTGATFKTLRLTVKELRVRDSMISRKFKLSSAAIEIIK
jgi:hypothetical protein